MMNRRGEKDRKKKPEKDGRDEADRVREGKKTKNKTKPRKKKNRTKEQ